MGGMRVLFLSGLYSTPMAPSMGVCNARVLHAMREYADIRVMAPLPWYPGPVVRRNPALRAVAELPSVQRDDDGSIVRHPRRLHVPRFYALHAALYAASVLVPVAAEIKRFRPDVLFSAWAYPDGTAATMLGKLFGLPTVVRALGSDINDFAQRRWRRPQIAWAMQHADRVVAVSAALGREIEKLGVDSGRIAVIPTGVDCSAFHPVMMSEARRSLGLPQGPLIVVPSRLSREKGIGYFIEALAMMDQTVSTVLVGHGPEEQALRDRAAALGVAERVRFAGFQPEANMKLFYSAADVVCLPSLEEGWPNVLVESFACGCPVVASDVGGVSEIISLTGAGAMAPPGDSNALASALTDALARPWNREDTARTMQHYTLAQTARQYSEICEEVALHPSSFAA